jgi:hypothetical protein
MTEPSAERPLPAPPRPGPGAPAPVESQAVPERSGADRFADLDERPVAEHVPLFEAEHDRLQRELGTIDQL